ncbi:PHP domain-containing protein [Aliikangiella marina]|uniref:PHP domain-containing protein n=1 Tax=Aliikangiella marina TaxID=1712262 RepID=UPI00163D72B5|nr:PHP domain-containing protein [Aliikangiella marina]
MSDKFDFHCHSIQSDGGLSPADLIDYALERNIQHLALTDHDCVSGLAIARSHIEENQLPISLIDGVELSAATEFGEIHVVGLAIDSANNRLQSALKIQQDQRKERAQQICLKLEKLGITGVLSKTLELATEVITRTHIACAIVELGHAKDMQQAFKKYIGKKGKVKVSQSWMPLIDAVGLIQGAGGKAVLAHPTRYPLTNRKLSLLIQVFKECGGDGIEMAYPSLNPDKMNWLKIHREQNDLLASSGSDFHFPGLKWTDLGRFPPLDTTIPHLKETII